MDSLEYPKLRICLTKSENIISFSNNTFYSDCLYWIITVYNYFDVVGLWHTKSSYYRQKSVIKNQSGCSRHHGGPSFFAI